MARPVIDDEVIDRLTETVEARTKVPAKHLGVAERIDFVLDELEDAEGRAQYLEGRVDDLEEELEAARATDDTGVVGTGPDSVDLGTNRGGPRDRF